MTEPIKTEQWKTIKDFPTYAVSTFGRIKRLINSGSTKAGFILKPFPNTHGYPTIAFSLSQIPYKLKYRPVHTVALETFVCPRPNNKQCNHKDGNRLNNYLDNLEWVTASENMRHSYRILGRKKGGASGERHGMSKLTKSNVLKIRKLYATEQYNQYELAYIFSVRQSAISKIILRQRWQYI